MVRTRGGRAFGDVPGGGRRAPRWVAGFLTMVAGSCMDSAPSVRDTLAHGMATAAGGALAGPFEHGPRRVPRERSSGAADPVRGWRRPQASGARPVDGVGPVTPAPSKDAQPQERLDWLRGESLRHDQLYNNEGRIEISDAEYDALFR